MRRPGWSRSTGFCAWSRAPAQVLDLPWSLARHRTRGQVHDRGSGGRHRAGRPAYSRAALGPADAVSVDRGRHRAADLRAESCVAGCARFPFACLHSQPPGLRRRPCRQPGPDRGLSLLLDSAVGGGIGVAVSQCRPAAHRDRLPFSSRPFHVRGQVLLRGRYCADRTCSGAHGGRRASSGRGCAPVSRSQSWLRARSSCSRLLC